MEKINRRIFFSKFTRAVGVVSANPAVQAVIQNSMVQATINNPAVRIAAKGGSAYSAGSVTGYIVGGAGSLGRDYYSGTRTEQSLIPTWREVVKAGGSGFVLAKVCGLAAVAGVFGWKHIRGEVASTEVIPTGQEPEV